MRKAHIENVEPAENYGATTAASMIFWFLGMATAARGNAHAEGEELAVAVVARQAPETTADYAAAEAGLRAHGWTNVALNGALPMENPAMAIARYPLMKPFIEKALADGLAIVVEPWRRRCTSPQRHKY